LKEPNLNYAPSKLCISLFPNFKPLG